MIYKTDIILFIKNVLNSIIFNVNIFTSIDNLDGTQTVVVDDVIYLQKGFKITIGANEYTIVTVDFANNLIVVKGLPISVNAFTIYPVKFFYGSIRETANELKDYVHSRDKTPMLYLYEEFKERFNEEPETNIERESDLRLFFLTQADFQDWQRQDFQDNAIMPMRRLMERFIEELENTKRVTQLKSYETLTKTRFGVFVTDKGLDSAYWADNLSGIELRITIELDRDGEC